jgi:glycosyltransferase involved in cell wall biosynthesis
MDSNESDKEDSSNDDCNDYKADEKTSLKIRKHSDYSGSSYKKKKKYKNSNSILNIILQSIIIILIIVLFFFVFIKAIKRVNIKSIKDNYNLRNNKNNINNNTFSELKLNNSTISSTIIKDKKPSNEIIDDIKNIKPLEETINTMTNNILEKNTTKKKIGLAFLYSTLYSNGIARFITVTSKNLLKTGKYDICFITEKPYYKEFSYEPEIKRFIAYNNYTLIKNLSKYEHIDIVVLQNVLSSSVIKFHKNLGQKVICMFHGVFMSSMYHNLVEHYKNWDQFDLCDSFIFIAPDDYYFYKKLGFKNEIFIPNLYTFEPSEVISSNLTTKNIVILGRLNDLIKGVKYAIQAMFYIVKEVPDAMLYLVSSDSRIQFLKNLTRDLNLTNNIIFKGNTYNLTELFCNSSVHMFTSLSEAFPMAMNEGKAHGVPIVGFDVPYSMPYQQGFIGVKLFDVEGLARETIKLLKDYDYRKRMGEAAKKSLDVVKNNETVELWGRLCDSLMDSNRDNYRKLQDEIEKKYYNEEKARQHLEGQFNILLNGDFNLTCHHFDNFTDINYIKQIKACNMNNLLNNNTS